METAPDRAAPPEPAAVTVAIEGWNARDLASRAVFERCIASLEAQSYPLRRCDVLVAVDRSEAEAHGWIRERLPEARLLPVDGLTYARAKNALFAEARGEFVASCDSDIAYDPGWIAAMLAAFRPGVDLVVGRTRYERGFLSRTLDVCDWVHQARSGPTDWFWMNSLMFRQSLLPRVRLREDLGPSGFATVDALRWELRRQGIPFWFCAEGRSEHHLDDFLEQRLRMGAGQFLARKRARAGAGAWLSRIPLAGPVLIVAGTWAKAIRRAWRLRSGHPGGIASLPIYAVTISFAKAFEAAGALGMALAPGVLARRLAIPIDPGAGHG